MVLENKFIRITENVLYFNTISVEITFRDIVYYTQGLGSQIRNVIKLNIISNI